MEKSRKQVETLRKINYIREALDSKKRARRKQGLDKTDFMGNWSSFIISDYISVRLSQAHYCRGKAQYPLCFPFYSTGPRWDTVPLSRGYHWSFLFSKVCPWETLEFSLGGDERIIGKARNVFKYPASQGLNPQSSSLNKLFYCLSTLQKIQLPCGKNASHVGNFM